MERDKLDKLVNEIRKMDKKTAQDYIVNMIYTINDWVEYNTEEIRQYDELSSERDLHYWEKDDYMKCMTKMKSYNGLLYHLMQDANIYD